MKWARDDATVLAKNLSVSGGVLRVQGKHQDALGRHYTTGDMNTRGKFQLPNYFRLKVRAKVPFEKGMWAAPIWFRPADGNGGEIDLVETYGTDMAAGDPMVHQTIHSNYGASHQQTVFLKKFSALRGSATGWHVYTIEKTPGKIVMWVDGVKTATFNSATSSWYRTYYEAGKKWILRTNLQIGGADGSPDSSTNWSPDATAMQLDYVRAWVPED